MQYKKTTIAATVALSATVLSAYVPSEPWTTLTPTATYPGGISEYTNSFGIAVNPITTSIASTATAAGNKRRDAISQIGDGQIQATTATSSTTSATKTEATAVSQIGDGQIQATTATKSEATVVSQIGDGQIQATTATKTEATVVSQIGDGQIQATTATKSEAAAISQIGDGQIQATTATKTEAAAISQIGDGQIQATTATKSEATAVSQIGDGQIQATTATKSEATAISQIGDGQIQATTATKTGASQIGDGQVQATTGSASATATSTLSAGDKDSSDPVTAESCDSKGTLSMVLEDGVLRDSKGRIGSIVANRQFQFDGPPPQAGAIYAKGWSITPEGNLALGDDDVFYQCLSGDFYNLYDEKIGAQCSPINLEVVDLVSC